MPRHFLSLLPMACLSGLLALLAACGGGGGGDAAAPSAPLAPVANITVAAGGVVSSSDGRAQLIVGANSASAEASATIEPITPPAEVLAHPNYMPGTAYAYRGPLLDFEPAANWEIALPAAAGASAASAGGRKSVLAASSNEIDAEQLCQAPYAQSLGQPPQAVWQRGDTCPASCTKVRGTLPGRGPARSLCAPVQPVVVVDADQACPSGTEASTEPAWSEFTNGEQARVCEPVPATAAAVLGTSPVDADTSCATRNGKLVCKIQALTEPRSTPAASRKVALGTPIGGDWGFEDDEPPNSAGAGFQSSGQPRVEPDTRNGGYIVTIPDGTAYGLRFRPTANGMNEIFGLVQVELREMTHVTILRGVPTSSRSLLMWFSPAKENVFTGLMPDTFTYTAPTDVVVPYASDDAPVRYFYAVAYDLFGNARKSPVVRIARKSPTRPVINSFNGNPTFLPVGGGGATVLSWSVTGAYNVNILPSLGNVSSSGSAPVVVAHTTTFTLTATNSIGTSVTKNVIVTVEQDTTPPEVTLASSAATVTVPAAITLTANATDAGGVQRVEFYRNGALIATDYAAPYQTGLNFTAPDVGTQYFGVRAFDYAGNAKASNIVHVSVTDPPGNGDAWASPSGVDAGNSSCAQATPCLTIAKAASVAQPNKTVWLLNGSYTATTQPVPIAIPPGRTVRAVNAGLARIGQQIVMQGDGALVGLTLQRNGFGDWGSIAASSGNVTIDGVKAVGSSATSGAYPAVLVLSGTVHATMTPGSIADYADQLTPALQNVAIYGMLADSAWLTVNGGTFGGAALGGSDGVYGAFNRGAFNLTGSSQLELNNVNLNVDASGIFLYGDATKLALNGTTLHAAASTGPGYGIYAAKGTPQVTLVNATISGFDNAYSMGSAGIYVGTFAQPGVALTLTTANSTISDNHVGVFTSELGTTPSSLTWTGTDTSVSSNVLGGIVCRDACSLNLTGGAISNNGTQNATTASGMTLHGGLWMGMPGKPYFLRLRNTQVVDNKSIAVGSADAPDNSGLTIAGSTSSGFDLGSASSPGGNVIRGNSSGVQTTGLNVRVAAGVTVRAVGNTWAAGTQGANAAGQYQLGSAPCGAAACSVGSGSGANYGVTTGSLRLAE